ncbi:CvpA family protein [Helicobacter felistomachi]|uniref:CvpA family protein n=1 Tax=Helicobacter felistomachi TaxID=3040201 RepID=UPI0025743042|nr:CvpA family protein [Helicobacter sp. NHP21005]
MGSYIDIALLVFVVAIGIRGFYNGFIDEVAGLLGIVVGVFLASRWAYAIGASFANHIYAFKDSSMNDLVGFVAVLAGVWIAFLVVGIVVSKAITLSNLGVLDRILGFVFACTKMFLILSFLLYAISRLAFMKTIDTYLHAHSQVYPYMYSVASHILQIKEVQEFGEMIQQKAQNAKQESVRLLEKTQKPLAPTH